jgi:multidrug transporter EmrE-like cation transporter
MIYLLFSITIGFGLAIGDLLMKKWMLFHYSITGRGLLFLMSALVVYSISLIGYGLLLKNYNLNVATLIVVAINVIIVMLIGTFFFGESMSNTHIVGSLLCMVGVVLLLLH